MDLAETDGEPLPADGSNSSRIVRYVKENLAHFEGPYARIHESWDIGPTLKYAR